MTAHAGHEMIEALAAVILSLAGVVILVLAERDRRATRRRRADRSSAGSDTDAAASSMVAPASDALRRAVVRIAATLSVGAAIIHFAAGPEHVEELGDIGLGFYWAALFQAGWAIAYLTRPRPAIAWIGIAGNAAIIAAWAWTRTVGLPIGAEAGHAEAVGIPDAVATLLQVGLLALLLAAHVIRTRRAPRPGDDGGRPHRFARSLARTAGANATVLVVPLVGIVFLATTLAVSVAAAGHHGTGGPGGAGHDTGASHITSTVPSDVTGPVAP